MVQPRLYRTRLSDRQRDIMRFIERFQLQRGYCPTIREIGEATQISSTSVVNYNLERLQKQGYITRDERVSRGLRILKSILPPKRVKPESIMPGEDFNVTLDTLSMRVSLTGDRQAVLQHLQSMSARLQGFIESYEASSQTR